MRFLSNESSGKMGFALAEAAARAGEVVTLIAGPVALAAPKGVRRVDVVTAREMLAATRSAFRSADALFMCAAVSDWRPRRKRASKWRKEETSQDVANIELVRNPDILATLAASKAQRLVVGFALETGNGLARARAKLERKKADFIVLNDASVLGADRTSVTVIGRDGSVRRLENRTKRDVARELLRLRRS